MDARLVIDVEDFLAALKEKLVTGKDKVLTGFSLSRGTIEISGVELGGLHADEVSTIVFLGRCLIRGGEIDDEIGSCQGGLIAWRLDDPKILTDFASDFQAAKRKEDVCPDRDELFTERNLFRIQLIGRRKPPFFIEFRVVWNISLRN